MSDNDASALLREAENALRSFALAAISVSPHLKTPYTDAPQLTPWSLRIAPEGRRALEIAARIRAHLGDPHRMTVGAIGASPFDADALSAEIELLRSDDRPSA